jgi:dihydroflavonol-4-reductase
VTERVLITGVRGHIRANLTRLLLDAGHPDKVLPHKTNRALDGLDIEVTQEDIRQAELVQRAVQGCDVVFHLAAKTPIPPKAHSSIREIHVEGTRNVAITCQQEGVTRLAHCSSVHALD